MLPIPNPKPGQLPYHLPLAFGTHLRPLRGKFSKRPPVVIDRRFTTAPPRVKFRPTAQGSTFRVKQTSTAWAGGHFPRT